jgi:hypothetical protein
MTKFVINMWFWGCTTIYRHPVRSENRKKNWEGGLLFGKIVSIFWLFLVRNDAKNDKIFVRCCSLFSTFRALASTIF